MKNEETKKETQKETHTTIPHVTLGPEEARVVDALLESMSSAGNKPHAASPFVTPHVAPNDTRQARQVAAWLELIGQCPADHPPTDLTQRTLEHLEEVRRRRWFAQQAQAMAAPRVGFTWREVGAVAAILLIGVSLILPMLGHVQSDARKIACAQNLSTAGMALGSYAAANNQQLPRRDIKPGSVWWNVGQDASGEQPVQSNSAHLFTLVRDGYVDPVTLNCPENNEAPRFVSRDQHDWNRAADVSYSYQNQFAPKPIRVDQAANLGVLADKNPRFGNQLRPGTALKFRIEISPTTASNFHRGKGQNILLLHGGVVWTVRPVLPNGDNIWTARGIDHYNGTETPADLFDSFLVP